MCWGSHDSGHRRRAALHASPSIKAYLSMATWLISHSQLLFRPDSRALARLTPPALSQARPLRSILLHLAARHASSLAKVFWRLAAVLARQNKEILARHVRVWGLHSGHDQNKRTPLLSLSRHPIAAIIHFITPRPDRNMSRPKTNRRLSLEQHDSPPTHFALVLSPWATLSHATYHANTNEGTSEVLITQPS